MPRRLQTMADDKELHEASQINISSKYPNNAPTSEVPDPDEDDLDDLDGWDELLPP